MYTVEEIMEIGFHKELNMEIVELTEDNLVLKVPLGNHKNPFTTAHGGLIFTLADTVMGIRVGMTGRLGVTLDSTINYLKPVFGEYITADAAIIKNGKHVCVVSSNVYNDKGEVCAIVQANYFFKDE